MHQTVGKMPVLGPKFPGDLRPPLKRNGCVTTHIKVFGHTPNIKYSGTTGCYCVITYSSVLAVEGVVLQLTCLFVLMFKL